MNRPLFTLSALLCILSSNCSSPGTVAGGSIEVTNGFIAGTVLFKDGSPASGTVVSFVPQEWEGRISQLPDSLKDTTGSDGKFSIASQNLTGTIFAENGSGKTAGIIAGTFESATVLPVLPRTSVTMDIIGAGRIMEGTVYIIGSNISHPIHRGDTVVQFTDVPAGSVRGICWIPADSPSVSYEIYPEFQIREDSGAVITTGGAGRWFNPPAAWNYDTITAVIRDSRGFIWIGSRGKGLFKSLGLSGSWKECTAESADLKTVRALSSDGDTLYALGSSGLHRSVDGQLFTPIPLPGGSGAPLALASGNGMVTAVWADKAVWRNSAGVIRTFTSSAPFTSVCYSGSDQFILGTRGAGILTVTPSDSAITASADGLPSDSVLSVSSLSGVTVLLCTEGIAVKRDIWRMTRFSEKSLQALTSPRTVQVDRFGGVWCGGSSSLASEDSKFPFAAQKSMPGTTRPYPDLFSSCAGYHGGVLFGGVGGILMMP